MLKCGNKFCSNPEIKDAKICRDEKKKMYTKWQGTCCWQKDGKGCPECGEKTVRASGCQHCVECGASSCG